MNKVLLDTNAYSRLLKGNKNLQALLDNATNIYLSVVVIGEILAGFRRGTKEKENIELLDEFILQKTVSVIDVSRETADIYADLTLLLRRKGKPIPTNDVWIAAHTIETGAKLITFDEHFLIIPGLRVLDKFNQQ